MDRKYSLLRGQLILMSLAFSVIPLLVLGYLVYGQFSEAYRDKVETNMRAMVDGKQHTIDAFLNEKVSFIKTMAYSHTFEQMADKTFLNALYQTMLSNSDSYVDIGVIDRKGNHVSYAGPYDIEHVNYMETDWFHETMIKGVHISDVFLGFRNYPHFIVAVLRREGDKTWILRMTINLDALRALVSSVRIGKSGDAFLLNADNELMTPSRTHHIPLTKMQEPVAEPFHGVRVDERVNGEEQRLLGYAWLSTVPWMLVITQDPGEEMSLLVRTERQAFFMTLFAVVLVTTGAVLTSCYMVRRVHAADEQTAQLDAAMMHNSKMTALGKMAAGVAHEVNNPLTLICESSGWMRDLLDEEDPQGMVNYDELVASLDKIDRNVERAREVTHRMLGFGRRMDPMVDNVNLNTLVSETLKFLENEALHRSISLRTDFDAELPLVSTDPSQVQQVVLNLVDNAIDSIGENGVIHIHTETRPDEVRVSVQDTGEGIPPERLERIFDPFFTTKAMGEGTGLGLAIVFGIMQKLGGGIEAQSELGKGSIFTIHLPRGTRK